MIDMPENERDLDAIVDDILGSVDAGKKNEHPHVCTCTACGLSFEAKTPNAKYCMSCRQKIRREGGRKGAEKGQRSRKAGSSIEAKPVPEEDKAAAKEEKPMESKNFMNAVGAAVKLPDPTPDTLDADIQALAAHQADICQRYCLKIGQVAEAVTALLHYKAVIDRLAAEHDAELVPDEEGDEV